MPKNLLDVVGVNLSSNRVRVMAYSRDEKNASAFIDLALARLGTKDEFFSAVPAGMYANGDQWRGFGAEGEV